MKVSEISTNLRCSFSKCAQPSRTQRNIRSFLLTSVRFSSLLSPVLAQFSVFVDPFTSPSLICVFASTWRGGQEKVNTSILKQKLLSIVNMFINAGRRYRRSLVEAAELIPITLGTNILSFFLLLATIAPSRRPIN